MSQQQTDDVPHDLEFASALDRALAARRRSLTWLHDRLRVHGTPVSMATLSYWRSGQRLPERVDSMRALDTIEELLDIPTGHLAARIGRSRRTGPDPVIPFDALTGNAGALQSLLDEIGCSDPSGLVSCGGTVAVDLGADRLVHRTTNRMHWRARRSGVETMPVYLHLEHEAETPPQVEAVSGCHVGRQVYDEASRLLAAELVLDRPLRQGETAITEHRVDGVLNRVEPQTYRLVAERRVREGSLWVRFHRDATPTSYEAFSVVDGIEQRHDVEPIGGTVHHTVRSFGPGAFGLDWEW